MKDLIFSLDPGSKKTGWAVMGAREQLIKAGLLLPDKQTAPSEFRIDAMCRSLWELLNLWLPGTILIEWTSGKVQRRHKGGGAGLAIHGAATGSMYRECVAWLRWQPPDNQINTEVVLIHENQWTRGVPKKERAAAISAMFPQYKPEQDPGGDIADAIGINVFYQRERLLRAAELIRAQDKK